MVFVLRLFAARRSTAGHIADRADVRENATSFVQGCHKRPMGKIDGGAQAVIGCGKHQMRRERQNEWSKIGDRGSEPARKLRRRA